MQKIPNKIVLMLVFLVTSVSAYSQHFSEILQYSMTEVDGSARTVGAGGGLSALGADFGTITQNAAGLAQFRRSEFVITLGLDNTNVKATFGTNNVSTKKSFMQLPNVGVVFASRPQNIKWKTMNFSVGYNRQISYNRSFNYEGPAKGSITQRFSADADDLGLNYLDNYGSGLAYDVGAIYDLGSDLYYETDFDGVEEAFFHRQEVTESGHMGELTIALAGNYDDKLSVGGSVGIPILEFQKEKQYFEEDKNNVIPAFDKLRYDESLTTSGTGFNAKLGLIYRINQMFRTGLAIHSPTWISLTDNYNNTMLYQYTENNTQKTNEKTPDEAGIFEYKVVTPWRAIVSLGTIIGRKGFISADVELVDYSSSSFNLTSDIKTTETKNLERELNKSIDNSYRQAVNFRIGGEYALNDLRFRLGAGFYGSAIENDKSVKRVLSSGVGYRTDGFFVDLAYRYSLGKEGYSPFVGDFMKPNGAVLNTRKSTISFTVGLKF